jgi:hypothetical protein
MSRNDNLEVEMPFWAFLRFLDRTVYRTVLHRHDGP